MFDFDDDDDEFYNPFFDNERKRMKRRKVLFDRHHRKPRSIGGRTEKRNLSYIPRHLHEAWHLLFQNFTAEQIAVEINKRYLDPDYMMIAQRIR